MRGLLMAILLFSLGTVSVWAQPEAAPPGIVGLLVRQLYDDRAANHRGALVVISVTPGPPAALAGVAPGDMVGPVNDNNLTGNENPTREILW